MDFQPQFRIREKTTSGYDIFILGHQFDSTGPIHYFNDHRHAHNFCRYLFSQTKAHPTNHLTPRNVVCEFMGPKVVGLPLDRPEAQFLDFMRRNFPKEGADRSLCDDGAYVSFAVKTPENHVISNIARHHEGNLYLRPEMIEFIGGNQDDMQAAADVFEKAEGVICFDEVDPNAQTLLADRIVQRLVSRQIGGEALLTVSHRDQLDHNQTYHIHRLLRRA